MLFAYFCLCELLRAFADPPADHEHTKPTNGRCTSCYHRVGDGVHAVPATRWQPWRWGSEIHGRASMRYRFAS